jgi:nucleoid DNA-binding protein
MNPKKPKEFVKPTADELELPEQLVEDIASFYWSSLAKSLNNIESASVRVTGLGTFNVRVKRIKKLQGRYNKYLDEAAPERMTFSKHSAKRIAEFKLGRLEEIEKHLEQERERREEVKQKRKEYVNSKNMGE